MKAKTLFFAIAIGFNTLAICQKSTIDLTFTAKNNGKYIALDSILIENLTQGGDTVLFAPDTALSLDYITGIDHYVSTENGLSISQNYPNPFNGKTEIMIYLPQKENINITVHDIVGKELIQYDNLLNQGSHHFTFYSGEDAYYILAVMSSNAKKSIKMLNRVTPASHRKSCRIVYQGIKNEGIFFKSQKDVNEFVYSIGDELQFSGFSTTSDNVIGNAIITDTPVENTAYEFDIIKGIRCPGLPIIMDIDNNVYYTVQIGDQCWMKDNLKTTKYKDGTSIPNVTDNLEWSSLSTGAYEWYDNDDPWKDIYGALYNWYTTVNPSGLCPTGWHVPEHDEWTILTDYIGGINSAGAKLKSCRQVSTFISNDCNTSIHPRWDYALITVFGTDDYGFSGTPGGDRFISGTFANMGLAGDYWTSSEENTISAWFRQLYHSGNDLWINYHDKRNGHSVRCLKNSEGQ